MPSSFGYWSGGIGNPDSGDRENRLREAIVRVRLPVASGKDAPPHGAVANDGIAVFHEAATDFIARLAIDDVDPAGTGICDDGGDAHRQARDCREPSPVACRRGHWTSTVSADSGSSSLGSTRHSRMPSS